MSRLRNKEFPANQKVIGAASKEEPVLLAMMLRKVDVIEKVLESRITPNHFFFAAYGNLFNTIVTYWEKHGSLLSRDAYQRLVDALPDDADGAKSMVQFTRIKSTRANIDDLSSLIKALKERYLQWMFYDRMVAGDNGIVQKIVGATHSQSKLFSEFQDKLIDVESEVEDSTEIHKGDIEHIRKQVIDRLIKRRENPEANRGLMTGISAIDNATIGLRKGEYIVLVGHPNGGKTTMMLNMATGMVDHGGRVLYVTVEQNNEDTVERIYSMYSGVPSKKMRVGGTGEDGLCQEEFAKILEADKKIEKLNGRYVFVHVPRQTNVGRLINIIRSEQKKEKFDAVFVDYLDVIESNRNYGQRSDLGIGEVSVSLQSFATTEGIVLVTAQSFNNEMIKAIKAQQEKDLKEGHNNLNHVVDLHGVGGSQKIVRDADIVLGLIMEEGGKRLAAHWMKSRNTEKAERFCFRADLDCGRLYQIDQNALLSDEQQYNCQKEGD